MLSGVFIALCLLDELGFCAESGVGSMYATQQSSFSHVHVLTAWLDLQAVVWHGPGCLPGTATTTVTPITTTASAPGSTSTTGLTLRLLPLGDSITFGLQSSDGNGYRSTLHNFLSAGNTVDFIGSLKSGTMADNDNEGHSGATIVQIQNFSTNAKALPARPNVVLLMAGTNDVFGVSISTGPSRLSTLIDSISKACPDAALVVATLTPFPSGQAAVDTYNQAVTLLVAQRRAAGQHILLASMASVLSSDLVDGVHPTDAGYVKMANAWFPVIQQAAGLGNPCSGLSTFVFDQLPIV
ncbi:SGNH hydrolase-type esterase domain-containing protein [Mycena pura]|uniref:SGNH hydrolase-type esterase domain-containing protein n=1 Tax=Mycena pura TaxID=153505 RepID=A0AAD6YMH1_9AGAR|nr:SGNH hydrolase-type esterase domain-containing protein [Mycena pura]